MSLVINKRKYLQIIRRMANFLLLKENCFTPPSFSYFVKLSPRKRSSSLSKFCLL
ncbi:MAG: hypothetical protein ACTS4T_00065 [Candidatus Hodgkinia cicadicola]